MDITKSNFKEKLPSILSSISDSEFLSCDGEFTGITYGKELLAFDTPEERYLKLREGASNFLLIQFGLCTFHYDESQNKYTHRAFNFYIFPRQFKKRGPDCRFLCQGSSLSFLANQGFNFNKLINEGISYLTPGDEEKLRTQIEESHEEHKSYNLQNDTTQIPIPLEHEGFIDSICTKIDLLLESSTETTINLSPTNRFVKKLIHQTAKSKYKDKVYLNTKSTDKDGRYSTLSVTKVSNSEELEELEDAKLREEFDELDEAIGFSKIIKCISQSGKLLVGHNMLLDLLLVINQFRCPLPDNYEDFKALSHSIFPRVLDTKLMASTHPFKEIIGNNTVLDNLQKQLSKAPFVQVPIESSKDFDGYSTDVLRLHEAGYDAYITGVCFVSMCAYIGSLQKPALKIVLPQSPLLDTYLNKLFLQRIQDIPYMNLGGEEVKVNRDHVFHLTFPKEWKTADLNHLFSPYGPVFVSWINDVSAFVALKQNWVNTSHVMRNLGQSNIYKVLTYKEHVSIKKENEMREIALKPDTAVDIDNSTKRKRNNAAENSLKRTKELIPEEEENREQPVEKKKRNEDDKNADKAKPSPNKKTSSSKKKANSKSSEKVISPIKGKKLFEEVDSWDD